MIPRTKEFFISLKDHDEWGIAHTVWGEVNSTTFPEHAYYTSPILLHDGRAALLHV